MYDGAPIIHRHYNAAGEYVGHTEIVSPWDDDARAEAEALWESDRLICSLCGNVREDCSDPDRPWYPQRHVCYASRAQAVADRQYGEKHNKQPFHNGHEARWTDKYTPQAPFHFRDGTRVWVSQYDLTPDDGFI